MHLNFMNSDPTEASLFIIPLDFGANCYMDATTAEIRRGGGLLAWEIGAMLQQLQNDTVNHLYTYAYRKRERYRLVHRSIT
jgi:hypothetical protein